MKKKLIQNNCEFIKKIFIRLVTSIVKTPIHTKCVSLSNQKCTSLPSLINLLPN